MILRDTTLLAAHGTRMSLIALIALILGCTKVDDSNGSTLEDAGSGPGPDASQPGPMRVVTIGPEGGVIEDVPGIRVIIPADALTNPTAIGVRALSDTEAAVLPTAFLPEGDSVAPQMVLSEIYELTPHGTSFAKPIQLEVTHDGSRPSDELRVARLGQGASSWSVLGSTVTSQTVLTANTSTFSYVSAVGPFGAGGISCDVIRCPEGQIKSCSDRTAHCWRQLSATVAPPEDGEDYKLFAYHDTVGHAVDLDSNSEPRYEVFVWSNVERFEPSLEERRFALSFFPVGLDADLHAGDVIQTESIPWVVDKLEERGALSPEVKAVLRFSTGYVVVAAGMPGSYSPQPLLFWVSPGGDSGLYKIREIRPTFSDRTGLLEEWQSWADLRLIDGLFGVKDGGELHVVIELDDEVSFQRPVPTVRWTLAIDDFDYSDPSQINVAFKQAPHLLREDVSDNRARLGAIGAVRPNLSDSRLNAIGMLWSEGITTERTGEQGVERITEYHETIEIRNIRTMEVNARREMKTATYDSSIPGGMQVDCIDHNPVAYGPLVALYSSEPAVADGLSEVAFLAADYNGVTSYVAATSEMDTSSHFTCREPLDFDPNMNLARPINVRFAPGGTEFGEAGGLFDYSILYRLFPFEFHSSRFAVYTHSTHDAHEYIEIFETPDSASNIEMTTVTAASIGGYHRVYAVGRDPFGANRESRTVYTILIHAGFDQL